MRILDTNDAALDALDLVAPVAELKYVACEALDREVFVHGADDVVLGLEQHLIVGVLRDSTARRQGGQPRAAAAAQHAVHRVVVAQCAAPAAPRAEAISQPFDDGSE